MAEQFKVSDLKEFVSHYDEFIEVSFPSKDKEYTVKLYPFFSPSRVRDLVNELIDFYKLCEKEKLTIPQIEEDDLVGYFILKHFTNMIFTKSKKATKIYEEFKIAIDSDLFSELLKAIPETSVQSVHNRIFDVIEASSKIKNQQQEFQDEIKNLPLENRDILFPDKSRKQIPEA